MNSMERTNHNTEEKKMARELSQNEINVVGFRQDNTQGYTQAKLDKFNEELAEELADYEPYSDMWYQMAKAFADSISHR